MPADPASDPNTPNVLLICCDHLRADWLGCNGHPIVQTPQMNELARQGANFRRAFSQCPVCVPARRVLMTGQGTYAVNMDRNRAGQPFPEGPKLAEVMTRAGYQTFASGKLHTCPQRNRIGFEDVQLNEEGRKQAGLLRDDYEQWLDDNGFGHLAYTHGLGNNEYGMRLSPLPEKATTTHWTAQRAMEFLDRRDPTRPFFLYVSFDKPHPPVTPPAEYYELYRDVEFPEPVIGDWEAEKMPNSFRAKQMRLGYDALRANRLAVQQTLRGFAAMVTHIDSMIGVILGHIREMGLLDNTLIILTSDHGDALFDHHDLAKCDFTRGPTNVPFIVRPPRAWSEANGFEGGLVDERSPVDLMDIMPTILDVCDEAVPVEVQGRSVMPLLVDASAEWRSWTFGRCGGCYGVSDGRMKYIWFAEDDYEFLFDMDADPYDQRDLSGDTAHALDLERLRGYAIAFMSEHGDERAADGRLVPIENDGDRLRRARTRNGWNNRGRH